ncbi:MAG: hypothetical protein M1514_01935 [Patescibacteria group bacterium]|nr:hypothetical protein [Patescibacteria group bacterium]
MKEDKEPLLLKLCLAFGLLALFFSFFRFYYQCLKRLPAIEEERKKSDQVKISRQKELFKTQFEIPSYSDDELKKF